MAKKKMTVKVGAGGRITRAGIVTTAEAAAVLGVSVQRVRQLIKELELEPVTIGKAILLNKDELALMQKRNTRAGRPKRAGK